MSGFLERSAGLHLAEPAFLLVALVVLAALIVRLRRGRPGVLFPPLYVVADGVPAPRGRDWPLALRVLAVLLGVVALARPAVLEEMPRRIEGIDVLLCLDVSSSMSARDLDEDSTRLDAARDAAASFVARRPHDRIGLVGFARYPDLLCPPTLDHRALAQILERLELVEHQGPEDATAIGAALAECADVLSESPARSRVVVLLTDGAENVATVQTPHEIAPLHAAQLCRDLGIRVYSIAAATEVARDWGAADTAEIEAVAAKTGGRFFAARDAADLEGVYAAIDDLERSPFEETRYESKDRFVGFVVAAAALFFLARLVESFRRGATP